MKYSVEGTFTQRGKSQSFRKEVEAESEHRALETALATVGSNHRVKRHDIVVHQVAKSGAKK